MDKCNNYTKHHPFMSIREQEHFNCDTNSELVPGYQFLQVSDNELLTNLLEQGNNNS